MDIYISKGGAKSYLKRLVKKGLITDVDRVRVIKSRSAMEYLRWSAIMDSVSDDHTNFIDSLLGRI